MIAKGAVLCLNGDERFYPGWPIPLVPIGPSVIETWFRQGSLRPKSLEIVLFYELIIRTNELGGWFPLYAREAKHLFEFALADEHVRFYLEQRKLVLPTEESRCFDLLMSSFFFILNPVKIHEFNLTHELVSTLSSSGNLYQE